MRDSAGTPPARPPPGGHYGVLLRPISQYKYYISQRRCGRTLERMSGFMFRAQPNLIDWSRSLRPGVALISVPVAPKKKKSIFPTCGIIRVICPQRNKIKDTAEVCVCVRACAAGATTLAITHM